MMNELITLELQQFIVAKDRVEDAILNERSYLQEKANQGQANPGYINKMNYLLGTMWQHIEATNKLLEAIGLANDLMGFERENAAQLRFEANTLRSENKKMRAWLQSIGKDLTLLPYIRETDFRYL